MMAFDPSATFPLPPGHPSSTILITVPTTSTLPLASALAFISPLTLISGSEPIVWLEIIII